MSITFTADEVFEMAEEIERNGAKFYRKAAEFAKGQTKQFLLDMAVMEDGHVEVFSQMRAELSEKEKGGDIFDPEHVAAYYLQAMADSRGSEGKKNPAEDFTGKESPIEIIEAALNAEKESVVFYFGLMSLVNETAGKDKVEKIIYEELSHITILLNELKKLQG